MQVEIGNIAPDPRDALRAHREEMDMKAFQDVGRAPVEQAPEEYPALPSTNSSSSLGSNASSKRAPDERKNSTATLDRMTPLGWIKVDKRLQTTKKKPTTAVAPSKMKFFSTIEAPQATKAPVSMTPPSSKVDSRATSSAVDNSEDDLKAAIVASIEDMQKNQGQSLAEKIRMMGLDARTLESNISSTRADSAMSAPLFDANDPLPSATLVNKQNRSSKLKKNQRNDFSVNTWETALKSVQGTTTPRPKVSSGIAGVIRPTAPTPISRPKRHDAPPGLAVSSDGQNSSVIPPPPGFSELKSEDIFKWKMKIDEGATDDDQANLPIGPRPTPTTPDFLDFPALPAAQIKSTQSSYVSATGSGSNVTSQLKKQPTKSTDRKSKLATDVVSLAFR